MQTYNTAKYRISVSANTSSDSLDYIKQVGHKAFMGVSLGNPKFDTKYMPSVCAWLKKHFKQTQIIVADYIHRLTLEIETDKNEYEATIEALDKGKRKYAELSPLVDNNSLHLYNWFDSKITAPYKYIIKAKNLYANNSFFRQDVLNDAREYLLRKKAKHLLAESEALSIEYILEEIAFINYRVDSGYNVSVYIGTQLNVIKNLAKQVYGDIDFPSNFICIDLNIKK